LVRPQEFTRFSTEAGYDDVIVYDCQPDDGGDDDSFSQTYLGRLFVDYSAQLWHDRDVCSWRAVGTMSGVLDEARMATHSYDSSSPFGLIVHFRTDGSVTRNGWDATFEPLLTTSLNGFYADYSYYRSPPSVTDAIRASYEYLRFNAATDSPVSFVDHHLPRDGRPTPYRGSMDAIWAIRFRGGGGQPNSVNFTRFDMAADHVIVIGVSASNGDLDYTPGGGVDRHLLDHLDEDYLEYDSDFHGSVLPTGCTRLDVLRGSAPPGGLYVQTHDPLMLVFMRTFGNGAGTGFAATYGLGDQFCDTFSRKIATTDAFTFSDGLAPGTRYRQGLQCRWLVSVPQGSADGIRLSFDLFALYPGDTLEVHAASSVAPDMRTEAANLLAILGNGTHGGASTVRERFPRAFYNPGRVTLRAAVASESCSHAEAR
jgi:hypothetical protein